MFEAGDSWWVVAIKKVLTQLEIEEQNVKEYISFSLLFFGRDINFILMFFYLDLLRHVKTLAFCF